MNFCCYVPTVVLCIRCYRLTRCLCREYYWTNHSIENRFTNLPNRLSWSNSSVPQDAALLTLEFLHSRCIAAAKLVEWLTLRATIDCCSAFSVNMEIFKTCAISSASNAHLQLASSRQAEQAAQVLFETQIKSESLAVATKIQLLQRDLRDMKYNLSGLSACYLFFKACTRMS